MLAKKIAKGEISYKSQDSTQIPAKSAKKLVKLSNLSKKITEKDMLSNKRQRINKTKSSSNSATIQQKDLPLSLKRGCSGVSTNSRTTSGHYKRMFLEDSSNSNDDEDESHAPNIINNKDFRSHHNNNNHIEYEQNDNTEELKFKIKDLILSKVELPCTTSCKHLLSHIEVIKELVGKVKVTDVYEVSTQLYKIVYPGVSRVPKVPAFKQEL